MSGGGLTPSIVTLVFAAVINSVLGLLVYKQSASSLVNRRFFYLTLAVTGWVISNAAFAFVAEEGLRYGIGLISYSSAMLVALFFYLFCKTVTGRRNEMVLERFIIVGGFMLAAVSAMPGLIAYDIEQLALKTHTVALAAYGVALVAFFGIGLLELLREFVGATHKQARDRIAVILIGLSVAVAVGVSCNLLLPLAGEYDYVQFGPISSLVLVVAIAYAIVRHRLFDVKLAAIRTVAYGLTLTTLAAIYYAAAFIVSVTLFRDSGITPFEGMSHFTIVIVLVLSLIFQPIKRFFDSVTDGIFYREQYSAEEFYVRLSEVLTTTTDLRNVLERASVEIAATLKADQAFFFVQHNRTHHISAGTSRHSSLPLQDVHTIEKYIDHHGTDIIVADLLSENHTVRRLLISHRIAILMPLIRGSVVVGYLALGEQRSRGYTNRDVKVLRTISDELIIAIQNALSVQEVKDINTHLQQRIDAATAELRTSNTQLRHLDKTKDEFLSMASHQLRTPLTSVKGYLSMVLEGDAGKVNKMQKQLLSEAYTSSERMVHLIHDFLNVSRLQTGKFMLELHPYDIAKLIDEEVKSLQRVAELRNMKLDFVNKAGQLVLLIDENKIRQVVMNFIDNALFYSHDDSTIIVELAKKDDAVELRVKDTGIGVPKGEQSELFTKFYRASNARKQRPDGTGVGIFLAKKVITEHGGDVLFESTEGKGSTFGFKLPIKKLQVGLEYKLNNLEQ